MGLEVNPLWNSQVKQAPREGELIRGPRPELEKIREKILKETARRSRD